MKVGIVGFGVVGKAIHNTLSEKYNVIKYDKYLHLDKFESMSSCDLVFVSVPTPFDTKINRVDECAVIESLEKLDKINYKGLTVIKSTLPPGSCDKYHETYRLDIVYNPEFLRESQDPDGDFKTQNIIVIGNCEKNHFEQLKIMYENVLAHKAEYFDTTFIEAELVKSAQNTMLASRVALANVIFEACKVKGVSYKKIKNIAFDRFEIIGSHMTEVPGPDGELGFGGKCLPKDILAFNSVFNSSLIREIISYNESLRNDLHNVLKNFSKK